MDDYKNLNSYIASKTKDAVFSLQKEQDRLGMKHDSDSLKVINTRLRKQAGFVSRISFKFKKSGIFVHKGVGRGTPISKAGTTNRKAKEWFNPVIEKYANELMEGVADEWIDITFSKLKIK
jgi:hypothetical protein